MSTQPTDTITFNRKRFDQLIEVARAMSSAGYSDEFVFSIFKLGMRYEGTGDLMIMWFEEDDPELKDEIIADLQAEIDEESEAIIPERLQNKDYLRFDDLEAIAKDVMRFKNQLKTEVERWGGISRLAKETGIPQSSLSRFFISPSMPRRSTLEKIARAMHLQSSQLLSDWISK